MEIGCSLYIKTNDLNGLVDWLNEEEANIKQFSTFLFDNVEKYSKFICEYSYFIYFGKIKENFKVFNDEDMNSVASSLGSSSIYSDGRSGGLEEKFLTVKGYKKPEKFMEFYSRACHRVDENLAFSSVVQILRNSGEDLPGLLKILTGIIERVDIGRSSLITNSLVSILGYIEEYRKIKLCPLIHFLESVWEKRDTSDSYGVSTSSLQVFCTNLIVEIMSGNVIAEFDDGNLHKDPCMELANLVSIFHENVLRWVCSLSLVHSAPVSGPLDNMPLNEAVCLFLILTREGSMIPKIYSLRYLGLMLMKISHLFLSNQKNNIQKIKIVEIGIKSSDLGLDYLEKNKSCSNSQLLDYYNTFPWQPAGYCCELLNNVGFLDSDKASNLFKRVLLLSERNFKVHILKEIMKSVTLGSGICICLMECKNLSTKWARDNDDLDIHLNFFKYVVDIYFKSELILSGEDSMYDSLSVVLNWFKFLLLSKNRTIFKHQIKLNYSEILKKLYYSLEDERATLVLRSSASQIHDVSLNRLDLIKMLLDDQIALLERDD